MRVLFLDIDGVLNRRGTRERCGPWIGVDQELADLLLSWLNTTDIKIVLSSTWRLHPEMFEHLEVAGIKWIGITPDLAEFGQGLWNAAQRGDEIKRYLGAHGEIERYAIIDDYEDMLPEQQPYFVRTNDRHGITPDDIEKLKAIYAEAAADMESE